MLNRGQSLLELIVVVAVSVIVVGALVFATISTLRNAEFAKNQAQATKLAQAGVERVRAGRNRNDSVSIAGSPVLSWNGNGRADTALWDYKIYDSCGSTGNCYLKFSSPQGGAISWIATSSVFPSNAELIPDSIFKRAIILTDQATCGAITDCYKKEKQVTVVVTWSDFSGSHESRLTTILRNLKI